MQRYFIGEEHWGHRKVTIYGEDLHHISRVMRMTSGDQLIGIHPEEGPALCKILNVTEDGAECAVLEWLEEDKELPIQVTIVAGLGKGDKLEHIVQKGTELGAFEFIPFQADRSVAKWDKKKVPKKIQRLQKIAKEASEQSERSHVPEVCTVHTLQQVSQLKDRYHWWLYAYENEARKKEHQSLATRLKLVRPGEKVIVIFGPEGGFSEKEVSHLEEKNFLSVRLGPRILRMETAPLYFLSSLSYVFEEER
ncbi:16S rRNA (uracil(1498)-N(3))-methyltransferase [Halobacillus litoralis]|uniref:Ribosomal RNA small subunit methyltransferase E n=1 Tax=Halobacillus litoralis TaxID=45668 RepID=A0A410MHD3_9BACI|nr:16S rRNA (uracil(1498)-N(3))-methyltransferase [Halobacillus litoralis]QAS54142.1 16S rRNA (uracil(1498)-N(3))-methyltransferase [Halobacillus litoralis]